MTTTYNHIGSLRQKQLQELGAIVQNKPIVLDQNLITSGSLATAIGVALVLLEMLTTKENSNHIKEMMGF
ncbi:type 1 glutamine amidotransferase family protein [Leptospira terpstrae]|uniref:DJ-1/PfpI domain protein n=1 Tax=Leptospira terpstrae serovar Hualin str. LT 11-33 = ATCC 700639 TaxID=1257025 RepID=N1VZ80_9LEPT|nr:hypothetical protein [Leptospira terpstrae]EMY60731.1 hypothetical protein LEP1GSC203_0539 [Leptospira terpstrae serovar Hualin str. LT 11-33 = ATCC 700639]